MIVETWLIEERDGTEYYWYLKGYFSKYIPAKTTGKPEYCYPAEGGELDMVKMYLVYISYGYETELPLYYHYCHPQEPTYEQVQVALWEQYDKARK